MVKSDSKNSNLWLIGSGLVLVSLVGCAAYFLKPYVSSLYELLEHADRLVQEAGVYAPLYIFLGYVASTILVLPLFGFHGVSGYVYGTFKGALLVSFSQTVGASIAFTMSRFLLRPYLPKILPKKWVDVLDAINNILKTGNEGFKLVILMRLSPMIPYSVTNYVCGSTNIPLLQFILGTWLGVLPGTTAYVNMGSIGRKIKNGETSNTQIVIYVVGIIATLLVTKKNIRNCNTST